MPGKRTRQLPKQGVRTFSFSRDAVKQDARSVKVSFSSEQPYDRWFGSEILLHDKECVNLDRLKNIGISLFNHNRDKVIGRLENIVIDDVEKKSYCDIVFDDDEETDTIYQKVLSGTLKGVSVGYFVDNWEEVEAGKPSLNGRFTGPCSIASRWTPFEVSIVSIPADDSVGVGRELEVDNNTEQNTNKKERENEMTPEELKAFLEKFVADMLATRSAEEQKTVSKEEITKAVEAEKERILTIDSLCRDFGLEAKDHFEKTIDEVKDLALNAKKEEMKALPASANIQIIADETDKFRDAASDAMLLRGGMKLEKQAEGTNDFRGLSLKTLAIECLAKDGVENAHRFSDEDLFKKALTPSSSFVSVVENVVSKSMRIYAPASTTFQDWTSTGSVSDFKEARHYRISESGNIERIYENGEFKHDQVKDEGISKRVYTYGKRFGFTRETLINDDIGVITKVPQQYVAGAYRTINQLVYAALTSSANIYDGSVLFVSGHSNLAGTATAVTTAGLSAGYKAMKQQKGLKGKQVLNIMPRFLIVSPDKEAEARQMMASLADPSSANANVANIYQGALKPIVDGELTGNAWFLAADPMQCDTIEVTYLNGKEAPTLESQMSFDRLGIDYRIFHDFGVNVLDFRGLYKNAGA